MNKQGIGTRGKKTYDILMIAGILCLGIGLRGYTLSSHGIWYDDAFSILLSKQNIPAIFSGTAADTMPPLYYLLLHFWMKVTPSIIWLRCLNLGLFLLLQWVIYQWVKEIASKQAAILALFFTAIAPFLIYHTHEIRMYMLLAVCQTAYFFFFTRWRKAYIANQKWIRFAIAMVGCAAAAFYTHNLAIFGLVIPGVYLVLRKEGRLLWRWGLFLLAAMLLFIPWLIFVPGQIDKIQTAFWTTRPGILEIVQSIYSLLSFLPQTNPWMMISGVLVFQFLVLLFWEAYRQRYRINSLGLLILGIFLLPLLLFVVSYMMRPIYVARGFILSVVLIYILAAILCALQWHAGFSKIIIGMLILLSGISLVFYYPYRSFPRSPFQEAGAYIKEHTGQDTNVLILHDNKLSYFPCAVYEPEMEQAFLGDEPGTHNDTLAYASQVAMNTYPESSLTQVIQGKQEVYFVVFTRALDEYAELNQGTYPSLETLSAVYALQDIQYFNDLAVYHYVQPAP